MQRLSKKGKKRRRHLNVVTIAAVSAVSMIGGCSEKLNTVSTLEPSMSVDPEHTRQRIPVPEPRLSTDDIVKDLNSRKEDPRDARERVIKKILTKHPEIHPSFIALLRDPPPNVIISSLPPAWSDIADLIAEVIQLQEVEYQEHPERFVTTDEDPNKMKQRLRERRREQEEQFRAVKRQKEMDK